MKKILLVLVACFTFGVMFCGCSDNETVLEASAIPLVSSILEDELGDEAAACIDVNITEQVSENTYKAIATLDNGNDIKIMIEDRGDEIYVSIPLVQ